MSEETELYDVAFHFPYNVVKIEKIPLSAVDRYASRSRGSLHFEVPYGKHVYIINPALLTYVHIQPYSPF